MYYEWIGFAADHGTAVRDDVPAFSTAEAALFLNFDGVLVEIAETPDAIVVPERLERLLNALVQATEGATALVTGRSAADVRQYLPGFAGTLVACHGGEIDRGAGPETTFDVDPGAIAHIVELVAAFAKCDSSYLAESKPTGAVLHFRRKPDLGGSAYHFLESILHDIPGFHIHHQKLAYEVRPDNISIDRAIKNLMQEPPFAGRRPVYIGDDVTDEPALAYCAGESGIAIKVGEGVTEAAYRIPTVKDVLAYLAWSLSEPQNG